MDINDFRSAHPEFSNVPDGDLAISLRDKFNPDMPQADFNAKFLVKKPGFFENLVAPIKQWGQSVVDRVEQAGQQNIDTQAKWLDPATYKSTGSILSQAVQSPLAILNGVFAPLQAPIGEAAKAPGKQLGVDPKINELIGGAAEMATPFLPLPRTVSLASKAAQMLGFGTEYGAVPGLIKAGKATEISKVAPEAWKEFAAPDNPDFIVKGQPYTPATTPITKLLTGNTSTPWEPPAPDFKKPFEEPAIIINPEPAFSDPFTADKFRAAENTPGFNRTAEDNALLKSFTQPKNLYGGAAGIEVDDNGELSYDPATGMMGLALGTSMKNLKPALSKVGDLLGKIKAAPENIPFFLPKIEASLTSLAKKEGFDVGSKMDTITQHIQNGLAGKIPWGQVVSKTRETLTRPLFGKVNFANAEIMDKYFDVTSGDSQNYTKEVSKWISSNIDTTARPGAISGNQKTLLSIDLSKTCPFKEAGNPCLYCYVEIPRSMKALGFKSIMPPVKEMAKLPYRDEVLSMPQPLVDYLNSEMGGLRMNSAGDFKPDQIPEVQKILDHAAERGLMIKAVTKQKGMVDAFGDHPNMRMNISVDSLNEMADAMGIKTPVSQAPSLDAALQWKNGRDNIKIRYVGFTPDDITAALINPKIDVVTMYHGLKGTNPNPADAVAYSNENLVNKIGYENLQRITNQWQNMSPDSKIGQSILEQAAAKLDDDPAVRSKICCMTGKCGSCLTCCGFGKADPAVQMKALNSVIGGAMGTETDDQGNITYDPVRGAAGLILGLGMAKYGNKLIDLMKGMGSTPGFGQELPKFAGGNTSVNLQKVGAEYEVKAVMNDTAAQYAQAAKQSPVTWEETQKIADDLGMTVKSMSRDKPKGVPMSAWVQAKRDVLADSATKMAAIKQSMADRVAAGGGLTDNDILNMRLAIEKHATIQSDVSKEASEAGRLLNIHNKLSQGKADIDTYKRIFDALGGREFNEQMVKDFMSLDPTDRIATETFIRGATKATTKDMLYEAWINGLLSAPKTHIRNSVSNTLAFLTNVGLETPVTATIEALKGTHGVKFGEAPMMLKGAADVIGSAVSAGKAALTNTQFGMWQGLKEGVHAALSAFEKELPDDILLTNKLESIKRQAIPGKLGTFVRMPGTALQVADNIVKSITYRGKLNALAYRQAVNEGLESEQRASRIADLISQPTDDMVKQSSQEALYRTFNDPNKLAAAVTKFKDVPYVGEIVKYVVPFVRTPTNIAQYAIERTPLALIHAIKQEGVSNSEAMARVVAGTLIGGATIALAKEGLITGGGQKQPGERNTQYGTGWMPYSFKIGNKYISYNNFEPMGSIMGMAADIADATSGSPFDYKKDPTFNDKMGRLTMSFAKNITSKTFLVGVSNVLDALSDPDRYGEKLINSFAGSAVPSIIAATAKSVDPISRETATPADAIQARLPYLSQNLPPKRDAWGKPITAEGDPLQRFIAPSAVSTESSSPVDKECLRLGVDLPVPQDKAPGFKLNPQELDSYREVSGKVARQMVGSLVSDPEYQSMSDDMKRQNIKIRLENAKKFTSGVLTPQFENGLQRKVQSIRENHGFFSKE